MNIYCRKLHASPSPIIFSIGVGGGGGGRKVSGGAQVHPLPVKYLKNYVFSVSLSLSLSLSVRCIECL